MPINNAQLPTTNVWDPSIIADVDINSPQFKEILIRLYQNINNMALVVNIKDSGFYDTFEFLTGQTYFPNPLLNSNTPTNPTRRPVIRKVYFPGPLPNTGTITFPHGIPMTPSITFVKSYGQSTDTTNFKSISLGYSSASGTTNVEMYVDGANVVIITASDRSSYNVTYVVLEYLLT